MTESMMTKINTCKLGIRANTDNIKHDDEDKHVLIR